MQAKFLIDEISKVFLSWYLLCCIWLFFSLINFDHTDAEHAVGSISDMVVCGFQDEGVKI